MSRSKYLNNRSEKRFNHRLEGLAEEEQRPFSDSDPPLRPEHSLRTLAASGWPLRSEGLAQSATSDSDPASPTGDRRNPAHHSSPTGATRTDWGHPTRNARSEGTRRRTEKASQGAQSQTMTPGTIPCIVLCNHPDTNSIVGADISFYSIVGAVNSHTVRPPHMPLGIDSVVGTGIYRTR